MTGNGLLGELAAWSGLAAPTLAPTQPSATAGVSAVLAQPESEAERSRFGSVLDVCDRVIGESSRRGHVFDWLQPAGMGGAHPVTVEAYYPGQRLVVLSSEQPEPEYSLCAELIATHGLRLFRVNPADFQGDSGLAFSRLLGELRLLGGADPIAPVELGRQPPRFIPAPAPARAAAPAPTPPAARAPTPPAAAAPARPFPVPTQPFPAPTQRFPTAPAPAPVAPPRPGVGSAFGPLVAAVHRFTAAPEPFVLPAEPGAEAALPPPPATPATATSQPFVASPPPVSAALQRYLSAPTRAPSPPAAPPPSAPSPTAPQSSVATRDQVMATPFPFTRAAPVLDPVLRSLVVEHEHQREHELKRRRVGQHQAEAAARAARFVEARAARSGAGNGGQRNAGPAPSARPVKPGLGALLAPAAGPFAGMGPAFAPEPRVPSRSTARAEAIERALAHGRPDPEADRRSRQAQAPSTMSTDELTLGMIVAVILLVELVLGVFLAGGGGAVVLGLGLFLDAGARALGTIAAVRSGKEWGPGWSWICGLIGSPAVVAFAFKQDGSLLATDPAPLAGPLAVVAVIVILIGLAGLPAGF